jgi:thymidylate synthase (FAD)
MLIVEPYARIIRPEMEKSLDELRFIERMGRISHDSEYAQTDGTWMRFLTANVVQHGDWSIVEHAHATVMFKVNRGVTHEVVRHRLFGFTQSSTRFINYTNAKHEPEYIPSVEVAPEDLGRWIEKIKIIDEIYREAVTGEGYSKRYAPQIARDFLPNALASKIGVTGNLRNWRHALLMRTTQETHPDFRRVTIPLLAAFKLYFPLFYDDIEPMAKQSENLKKAR